MFRCDCFNERQGTMLVQLWLKKDAFIRSERGATAIEYGLIAAGIALALSAVVFVVGADLVGLFGGIGDKLATAASNV